mmetsp:Transcript_87397/g.145245  ORF Transcript_87397/g.145245 Transcript_87397/m.145245 type:complete len:208 (+) Transcript_87397:606-1229(+)
MGWTLDEWGVPSWKRRLMKPIRPLRVVALATEALRFGAKCRLSSGSGSHFCGWRSDERERSLADGRRTDAVFSGGAAVTTFGSAEASSPPSDVHWDVFIRCCHFTRSESPCSIAAPTAAHSKRSGGTCCSVPFVGDRLRLRQAGLRRALMRPAVPGRDPKTRLWSEISTFLGRGRVTSAEVLWSAWKWDSPGTGGNEASPVTMPRAT